MVYGERQTLVKFAASPIQPGSTTSELVEDGWDVGQEKYHITAVK